MVYSLLIVIKSCNKRCRAPGRRQKGTHDGTLLHFRQCLSSFNNDLCHISPFFAQIVSHSIHIKTFHPKIPRVIWNFKHRIRIGGRLVVQNQ